MTHNYFVFRFTFSKKHFRAFRVECFLGYFSKI